jgi:hypothetical protein
MTTAADLINLSLKDSGVLGTGQVAQADDLADALTRLNLMISQWSTRRWLVYHLVDTACACTGATSYTVGTGGAFNVARPDRIEAAYIRQIVPSQPTPVDWYLEQITSREDYAKLTLKTMAASPSDRFFYDSDYPNGVLYPWPIPSSSYELHILTKAVLQQFANTGTTVQLPPQYEEALYLNLVVRNRAAYQLPENKVFTGLAKAALKTIRTSNFQISRLRMPLPIRRGPAYNVYSDQGG